MKWIVEGADTETGEDRVVSIAASNQGEAEAIARKSGLLVSTVRPATRTPGAPVVDDPVAQASRPRQQISAPPYTGLGVCISLLNVVAMLSFIGAVVMVLSAFADHSMASTASQIEDQTRLEGRMMNDVYEACSSVVVAVFMFTGASALGALRDIARNSFR